ncbi:MAG: hypothetical protein Q9197_006157, partial [Variospora fuerteventurae]
MPSFGAKADRCDSTPAHCDPKNCQKAFSGAGSSCAVRASSPSSASRNIERAAAAPTIPILPPPSEFVGGSTTTPTNPSNPYVSAVPEIDVCGSGQGGVRCPGAGSNGYFYRCCSSAGHCGPKNDDQGIYCGAGCQGNFGECAFNKQPPTSPATPPKTVGAGDTCGPIVNAKCGAGLCCSGSNFCGTGPDFCGAANWCQPKWGACSGSKMVKLAFGIDLSARVVVPLLKDFGALDRVIARPFRLLDILTHQAQTSTGVHQYSVMAPSSPVSVGGKSLVHSRSSSSSPPAKQQKLTGRAFYESIKSPKYILAPMVDQSEFAWRLLTRSFIPPAEQPSLLAYTPMFHARLFKQTQTFRDHHFQPTRTGLVSSPGQYSQPESDAKQTPYLDGHPTHDRPLIVQFCANNPEDFLEAAKHVSPHCDAVDLNLGCPQGIARKGHYGSFLQESPNLIHSLISKLAQNLDIPVTAKMRILDTKEETLRYASLLLDAGASWIAVHGRRREQKGHETGLADWTVIRYLRNMLPRGTVIFANGNVLGQEDLDRCLQVTGADAVMSAEGNLCDPAIFAGGEGRKAGEQSGEYWRGRDGKGGWRMDAVMRRYLDILYKFVLEKDPPERTPLFNLGNIPTLSNTTADPEPSSTNTTSTSSAPPPPTKSHPNRPTNDDPPPPHKKRKHTRSARPSSPNLLAVQAHLFHFLRPLLSKHTHIRDKLARAQPGDMATYEAILGMVEKVTRQGLQEYDEQEHALQSLDTAGGDLEREADGNDHEEEESSAKARRACERPWW